MAQSAPARNNASIGPSDYSKPKDDTMRNKCNSHCDEISYRDVLLNNSTELDGITDNVTKIQRQKSSTKFYNLIN